MERQKRNRLSMNRKKKKRNEELQRLKMEGEKMIHVKRQEKLE